MSTDKQTRTAALYISMISSFMTAFMGASVNIAIKKIADDLGMDAIVMSWVNTSYLLAAAVCLVPAGRFADINGRRKIFIAGMLVYSAGILLSAMAVSAMMLIAGRIVNGIGGAMIFGTGSAILMSAYPPQDRGRVLGISVAAVYVGLTMGPFLGGAMTYWWGWRSIFYANLPFCLAVIVMLLFMLKTEWAEAKGESFDLQGSIIFSIAIIGLIYGMSKITSLQGFVIFAAGAAAFVMFIFIEKDTAQPVVNVRLFAENRVYALSNLSAMIQYSAIFAVGYLLSLYLQYIKGLKPFTAGAYLLIQPAMMALLSPYAGKLSDRFNSGIIASAGMGFTSLGLLMLAFIGKETGLGYIVTALFIIGTGIAFFSSPNTNTIMGSVGRKLLGVASGTLGTMRMVGQMTGMAISLLLFAAIMGNSRITELNHGELIRTVRAAFGVFTGLCILAVFASLARNHAGRHGN